MIFDSFVLELLNKSQLRYCWFYDEGAAITESCDSLLLKSSSVNSLIFSFGEIQNGIRFRIRRQIDRPSGKSSGWEGRHPDRHPDREVGAVRLSGTVERFETSGQEARSVGFRILFI